jgi:hypothetical protein
MKIALLSFHDAANYGAVLQSYALQEALISHGYDCEYINYQNTHRRNSYNMGFHIMRELKARKYKSALHYVLGSPFMFVRKWNFKGFRKRYLRYTKRLYTSPSELSVLNHSYDKFIVGSDQVWNNENNGGDTAYLLDFVNDDSRKISYSSSFGMMSIPSDIIDKYKYYIFKIKCLSVRENYAVSLVRQITGRHAQLVLDPVFLLTKAEWLSLVANVKVDNTKYVFTYTNRERQFLDFLSITEFDMNEYRHCKLARSTSIGDFLSNKIEIKYTMSPIEFIRVIRDANLVVSASFHCIALSVILNKQFVAILTGNEGKDERLLGLLQLLGLEDRIFSSKMTADKVLYPIDYMKVNDKISALRKDSLDFLIKSINDK